MADTYQSLTSKLWSEPELWVTPKFWANLKSIKLAPSSTFIKPVAWGTVPEEPTEENIPQILSQLVACPVCQGIEHICTLCRDQPLVFWEEDAEAEWRRYAQCQVARDDPHHDAIADYLKQQVSKLLDRRFALACACFAARRVNNNVDEPLRFVYSGTHDIIAA